jgi:5-oxoprolinase (ATP-hydrolysing) subunit C
MFKVLSTGFQTTFQDLGRFGYRNLGVPLNGVMDQNLAAFANQLAGNPPEETVIEFTLIGPSLEIMDDLELVVAGIGFSLLLNGKHAPLNQKLKLQAGDLLKIGATSISVRGYLAVSGGFKVPKVLGSSSFYPMISPQLKIEKGSTIEINKRPKRKTESSVTSFDFKSYETSEIEVFKGPEFDLLSLEIKKKLLKSKFSINPQSNRMACLLDSQTIFSAEEIVTSPVQPGTVQLTPSGRIIVLMRDAQTTGGYARIFQLTEMAVNILAQKPAGATVKFKLKS